MRTRVTSGGESASTESVRAKPKTGDLAVPYREVSTVESIATGYRAEMFSLSDDKGKEVGSVDSAGGFGTDFITLKWGKQTAVVRGLDLLKAWVAIIDPEAQERMP